MQVEIGRSFYSSMTKDTSITESFGSCFELSACKIFEFGLDNRARAVPFREERNVQEVCKCARLLSPRRIRIISSNSILAFVIFPLIYPHSPRLVTQLSKNELILPDSNLLPFRDTYRDNTVVRSRTIRK